MQNLVLVVQNSIEVKNLGVATSAVTFFRSLGGTVGVSVLGSILGTVVAQQIEDGIPDLSPADQASAVETLGTGTIPQVASLPDTIRLLVEGAYGFGVGTVFLLSVPLAVLTLIAVIFLPNAKLGSMNAVQMKNTSAKTADREDGLIAASAGAAALTPAGQVHPTGAIDVVRDTDAHGADGVSTGKS
jgi:hypothetical protein